MGCPIRLPVRFSDLHAVNSSIQSTRLRIRTAASDRRPGVDGYQVARPVDCPGNTSGGSRCLRLRNPAGH